MALPTLKPQLQVLKPRLATVQSGGTWRAADATSTERGYGHAWRKARLGHLRSSPLCVMCEAAGRVTAAIVVDHRIPHRGDQAMFWDKGNWQSLCATHHSGDKQRAERMAGHLTD